MRAGGATDGHVRTERRETEMLLVGRIVKREEKAQEPLADTTYLIGVSATNLGKSAGDTIDLVAVEQLQTLRIPDWALNKFRERFPEAGLTNQGIRRQLEFWHRHLLPQVLKGRR